jgi:1,4-dihydroxy-2-naphthoyl-CoA hydrolase
MMSTAAPPTLNAEHFNRIGQGKLPGHLGLHIESISAQEVHATMAFAQHLMAPNGYLHAGALVTMADTCCGYGCVVALPSGASGFTTVELKSNHLGTALSGTLDCVAKPVHLGRTTHVWDATVKHVETGKTLALFLCTQMILYPAPKAGI